MCSGMQTALAAWMAELVTLIADSPAVLSRRDGIRALLQNASWAHDVSRPELDALAFAFRPLEALEGARGHIVLMVARPADEPLTSMLKACARSLPAPAQRC